MVGEQGDAPLVVVEAGRAGDDLQHATGELPPGRAVLVHHLLAVVVGQREPVVHVAALLRHRVEAPRRLALRRQLRVEAGLLHRLGHALGVLGQLGERDVGVDDVEPGVLQGGLEPAQAPQVGAEGHEGEVGLVAEHGDGDHLVAVGLGLLDGGGDGLGLGERRHLAEQVEHAQPDRGGDGVDHEGGVYGRPAPAPRSTPWPRAPKLARRQTQPARTAPTPTDELLWNPGRFDRP